MNPSNADAFDARGHVFEALGRRDEAIADFRKALSINPDIARSTDALHGSAQAHDGRVSR